MNIEAGYYVKCYLKYGISVEGQVISWQDEFVEIQSSEDNSISLISNPGENIFLTKILVLEEKKKETPEDISSTRIPDPPYIPEPNHYELPRFFKNQNVK